MMVFRKKKVLAVFLEKDNLKLIVYEGKTRTFAGQISFSPEVLRDGFVADGPKFASQIKIAFAQKEALKAVGDVLLFLSPDKTFTKTLSVADNIDTFVHGLPYFKEELVINTEKTGNRITYVAFEKKLVEDVQRPFLETGKKIAAVKSGASVLASKFAQTGRYLLLIPLEKEVVMAAVENGEIFGLAMVKNDTLPSRLEEFKSTHDLATSPIYTVGAFSGQNLNLQIIPLAQTDIYDLMVASALPRREINFNKKYLLLAGAILVGGLLVTVVVKNFNNFKPVEKKTVSPVAPVVVSPVPIPEPKKSDYPILIENGTLVSGEAGKLAASLKDSGFDVTETKNATSAGFVATRLRITKNVPDKIVALLKTDLLGTYESVQTESLATPSGRAVIQIIIGKKK